MGIWPFLLAGLMSLIIALLTVSLQSFKVARANPVDALKYE
jgi:ABC-type antimicrobial peptide transport system permease subunit